MHSAGVGHSGKTTGNSEGGGISATGHIRGWEIGARVNCYVGPDGKDIIEVYLTSGSHGCKGDILVGRFTEP